MKAAAAFCLAFLLCAQLFAAPAAAADAGENGGADAWDEAVDAVLSEYGIDPYGVGLAYYNTVTGEEHLRNGDRYYYAASVYKLPLNMYYAEQVYLGEMEMSTRIYGRSYGSLQQASLRYSANPESALLQSHLGSRYLDAILPYLTDDASERDVIGKKGNSFTPAQLLHALKLLYEAPERFPGVLDQLKLALPKGFFRRWEDRYPIAHKYGWIGEKVLICNDVGIVWTDEPILIVFMSNFTSGAEAALSAYCPAMCDYSQARHAERLQTVRDALDRAEAAERAAFSEAAAQALRSFQSRRALEAAGAAGARLAALAAAPSPPPEPEPEPRRRVPAAVLPAAAAGAAALLLALRLGKRRGTDRIQ